MSAELTNVTEQLDLEKVFNKSHENLENITSYNFVISPSDPHLEILNRENIEVQIHVFPKNWKQIPPSEQSLDPLFIKRLNPVMNLVCKPGSVAASSSSESNSVIQRLYSSIQFPKDQDYGLFDYLNGQRVREGVFAQLNGLYFNDGSFIGFTHNHDNRVTIIDEPLNSIYASEQYKNLKRNFITTDSNGKNSSFTSNNVLEIGKYLMDGKYKVIISASPAFIENSEVVKPNDIFAHQMLSDPRHYITIPYGESGPTILSELVEIIRSGNGTKIADALSGQQFTLELDKEKDPTTIFEAIKQNPIYKDDEISLKGNKILFANGLKRGSYNHLMYGIDKTGNLLMIQTSGSKSENGKLITGQGGLTIEEIYTMLNSDPIKKLGIVTLLAASQGRDAGHVITFDRGEFFNSQHQAYSRFNPGPNAERGKITTPRILIGI